MKARSSGLAPAPAGCPQSDGIGASVTFRIHRLACRASLSGKGPVDHHRFREGDAALELEALDGEGAWRGPGLLRRLGGAGNGCEQDAEREWRGERAEAPR